MILSSFIKALISVSKCIYWQIQTYNLVSKLQLGCSHHWAYLYSWCYHLYGRRAEMWQRPISPRCFWIYEAFLWLFRAFVCLSRVVFDHKKLKRNINDAHSSTWGDSILSLTLCQTIYMMAIVDVQLKPTSHQKTKKMGMNDVWLRSYKSLLCPTSTGWQYGNVV